MTTKNCLDNIGLYIGGFTFAVHQVFFNLKPDETPLQVGYDITFKRLKQFKQFKRIERIEFK